MKRGLFLSFGSMLLFAALAVDLRADFVTLKGARTVRAVAVTPQGEQTRLELLSGGTLTVATSSIESIEIERVGPEICAASPYRCQDRAMLLSRRAKPLVTNTPVPSPQR